MVKMPDYCREFIKNLCPALLEIDDPNEFLMELDDVIYFQGYYNDEITDFGREIEGYYDIIYEANFG